MATNTPRFDLGRFDPGEDGWDHTDAIELLDELAVEVDTIANRPSSGDYDQELYFAYDQWILYQWDPIDGWNPVAGLGQKNDIIDSTLFIDKVNANTVETNSLVMGGTLYEEDPNSPINTSTDDTFTLANSYDEVIIVTQPVGRSFDQLQVNGNSDTNYNYTDNSDTQTTGQAQFDFNQPVNRNRYVALRVLSEFDQIGMSTEPIIESTGATVYGRYQGTETSIDSLTLIDSGGASRTVKARVYGRSMSI